MKNTRWIICYDFETDLPNPNECNPVQLAAVPIDPVNLEVMKDLAFNAWIRPPGINKDEYFTEDREKTIEWHAKNYGITNDEVVEKWKKGMSQKIAWKNFCSYCLKYTAEKRPGQWYPEPIPAGYNIIGFDDLIIRRLCKKHKTKYPFSAVNKLDLMDNLFWWFENLDEPYDYKMDTLRTFLGIKTTGVAHDALTDVYEEASMVARFLKFHRKQARVDKFKNSFAGVEI